MVKVTPAVVDAAGRRVDVEHSDASRVSMDESGNLYVRGTAADAIAIHAAGHWSRVEIVK